MVWPVTGQAARTRAAMGPAAPAAGPAGDPTTPAPAATTTAPDQPNMDEVKRIYAAGKVKYETKNYDGAIDEWTTALGMLPNTPENREIRNDLVYNIATAQEKAYDIDKDVAHLRTARALLLDFLEAYKALYRPDEQTVAEFKRVNERIAALDAKIAEAEKSGPPPTAPVGVKRRLDLEVNQILRNDPVLSKQYKSGRSMVIGGSIALAAGGLLLLGAAAVSAQNDTSGGNSVTEREKQTNRNVAVSLLVVGLAAAAGGAALLGVGVPRKRKAKEAAVQRVVFAPTWGTTPDGGRFVGLGASGRF